MLRIGVEVILWFIPLQHNCSLSNKVNTPSPDLLFSEFWVPAENTQCGHDSGAMPTLLLPRGSAEASSKQMRAEWKE